MYQIISDRRNIVLFIEIIVIIGILFGLRNHMRLSLGMQKFIMRRSIFFVLFFALILYICFYYGLLF